MEGIPMVPDEMMQFIIKGVREHITQLRLMGVDVNIHQQVIEMQVALSIALAFFPEMHEWEYPEIRDLLVEMGFSEKFAEIAILPHDPLCIY